MRFFGYLLLLYHTNVQANNTQPVNIDFYIVLVYNLYQVL